jgi:hypothetical protein
MTRLNSKIQAVGEHPKFNAPKHWNSGDNREGVAHQESLRFSGRRTAARLLLHVSNCPYSNEAVLSC